VLLAHLVTGMASAAQGATRRATITDSIAGPLIVSSAPSMASTMRKLLGEFVAAHPGVAPDVHVGASVAAARAVADSSQVPDVFVTADDTVIDALLMPRYASWSAGFARSVLVLAYTNNSKYSDEISTRNWVDVLSRRDVRGARGDPDQDPGAYRSLMFFRLAARYYVRPSLPRDLERTMPITDFGPGSRELEPKFASGAIDYMVLCRTSAAERGLEWIELPAPVNLGDTAFAASYAAASVRIPSGVAGAPDTVTIRGSPILYGLTVPRAAPHPSVALAFARYVLSADGRDVILNAGFDVPDRAVLRGEVPPALTSAASSR
jgi:molybdate/tungstate transport system substrate-binding protein